MSVRALYDVLVGPRGLQFFTSIDAPVARCTVILVREGLALSDFRPTILQRLSSNTPHSHRARNDIYVGTSIFKILRYPHYQVPNTKDYELDTTFVTRSANFLALLYSIDFHPNQLNHFYDPMRCCEFSATSNLRIGPFFVDRRSIRCFAHDRSYDSQHSWASSPV